MLASPNALLWRGLLGVVVGVIAVVWPGVTIGAFVILFAVYAFMFGAMDAMRAFSGDRVEPVLGWLLLAALSFASGIVALAWPGITALVLTVWVAVWALATGVAEILLTFRRSESPGQRALFALSGLVSIALSFVLLVRPDIGMVTLATVFGLFSLIHGVSGIVMSLRATGSAAG